MQLNIQFTQILDTLLSNLQSVMPTSVTELVNIQLCSLQLNPSILSQISALDLPDDQLHVISTVRNILGPTHQKNKYPYFFITGSAGTRKPFILYLIAEDSSNKQHNFLQERENLSCFT